MLSLAVLFLGLCSLPALSIDESTTVTHDCGASITVSSSLLSTVDRRLLFVAGGDSRIFAPRSRRSPSVVVFALLLLRAGVESNPGPAAACVTGVLSCRLANHKIPMIHDLITDLDVLLPSETWFTSDTPQCILLDVAPAGYIRGASCRSADRSWQAEARRRTRRWVPRISSCSCPPSRQHTSAANVQVAAAVCRHWFWFLQPWQR